MAQAELAHHFGRHMAERHRGAILFVSSTFAFQGVPYFANYAASKGTCCCSARRCTRNFSPMAWMSPCWPQASPRRR